MEHLKKCATLIVVVLMIPNILTGCLKESKRAKAETIIDAYYTYLKNEEYTQLMALINPAYCEAFGEANQLEQQIQSHRKLMGAHQSYSITSIDVNDDNTVFQVDVIYQDVTEKQTIVVTIDDENIMTISELTFERPYYVDKMADDFFTAYRLGDYQTIYQYIHPRFYDYTTEEELNSALIQLELKAGQFRGYMLKDEAFYCMESETLPTRIYTGLYIATFEKISIYVQIELCEESDIVGINYIGLRFIEE